MTPRRPDALATPETRIELEIDEAGPPAVR
jgi:hypothetical protein